MSLAPGVRLGPYEVLGTLGSGGMGEVFRARDTKLHRDVAIKVLPAAFAQDQERVARFRREAQVLASLNHPNIAAIHGLEDGDGIVALALELVEGEDLAERLKRGSIPVEEAIAIAKQIAEGLEEAHDHGIVHRDLKPANVKLTPHGAVKILDFGLAKAYAGDAGTASDSGLSQSPTLSRQMTEAGIILGTAAYMSPEQARGKPVDKRADIWSFGVVLFEMLTGKRLFVGETVSDTLAAVLKSEPDWNALPQGSPDAVRRLLSACLEKDPRRRLRDIGDLDLILGSEPPAPVARLVPTRRSWLAWVVTCVAAAALGGWIARTATPSLELPVRRFELGAPEGASRGLNSAALSPDGTKLTFVAGGRLFVRELRSLDARAVAGSEGANRPFWSPDGQWVAYGVGRRLWKVPAGGGAPVAITDLPEPFSGAAGGAWGADGRIVLTTGFSGLLEVSDRGGDLRVVLPVDPKTDVDFHEASALPEGRGVVFYVHAQPGRPGSVEVFDGTKRKLVLQEPGLVMDTPVYSTTGHLLYRRSPTNPGIWAVPFSLSRLETTGAPFLVVTGHEIPSVSREGTLAYSPGGSEFGLAARLTWVDRSGAVLGRIGEPDTRMTSLALSPSGRQVAVTAGDVDETIWVYDLAQGTRTKLTMEPGLNSRPAWFPDGVRLAYESRANLASDLPRIHVREIAGAPTALVEGESPSVSPDGRYVVYQTYGGRGDIRLLDLERKGAPASIADDPRADEASPVVSPDGRWLAFTSDASGRAEVYVTSFPDGRRRRQVSTGGGLLPRWRPDGRELYFLDGDSLMAVSFTSATGVAGTPARLFTAPRLSAGFDAAPDGKRFLVLRTEEDKRSPRATLVQNWFAEFRSK